MKHLKLAAAPIVFAAAALFLTSCSEDQPVTQPASVGSSINFNIGQRNSRTHYGTGSGADQWQIYWDTSDQIRIFCNQSKSAQSADYTVIPDNNDATKGKLAVSTAESQLTWGEGINDSGLHNFYAAYGANTSLQSENANEGYGVLQFPMPTAQSVTLNSTTPTDNAYTTTPDMATNAYMVAAAQANRKTATSISLAFQPIMTTLEVSVNRSSAETENDSAYMCFVGGLEVTVPGITGDNFYYRLSVPTTSSNDYNGTLCNSDGSAYTTASDSTKFTVSMKDASGNDASIGLKKGESVTMTVFLPPVSNAKGTKIKVLGNNIAKTTVTIKSDIAASDKKKVTLPELTSKFNTTTTPVADPANWMANLDDNEYVNQVSIPGAMDAASYFGTTSNQEDVLQYSLKSKDNVIYKQFDEGCRAFELKTSYYDGYFWQNNDIYCYGSMGRKTTATLSTVLGYINTKLQNTKEFAVVYVNYLSVSGNTESDWTSNILSNLEGNSTYGSNIIAWRPDLTVGECRGKMIVIVNHDYNNRSKAALLSGDGNDWSDNATLSLGSLSTKCIGEGTLTTSDTATKLAKVDALYAKSKDLNHSDSFTWAENRISCGLGGTTKREYYLNNAVINGSVADHLNESHLNYNYSCGPAGIVMFHFLGKSNDGENNSEYKGTTYNTFGTKLLTAIINHNFWYLPKLKK